MNRRLSSIVLLSALMTCRPAHAELFDHKTWDTILGHYVNDQGYVDYTGIRQNAISALESYLEQIADADLGGWSRDERLAFWINAYNAIAVDLIANHPELKKLSDNFEIMNKPFKVGGVMVSLNDIEHRVLRDTVNPDNKGGPIPFVSMEPEDVRVLFALQPGTMGGPRLVNVAYTAENVEAALDIATAEFVNSSSNVDLLDNHLKLSAIFRWCRKDFTPAGGVAKFIFARMDPDKRGGDAETLKDALTSPIGMKNVTYGYDWTLNDLKNHSDDSAAHSAAVNNAGPPEPVDTTSP